MQSYNFSIVRQVFILIINAPKALKIDVFKAFGAFILRGPYT
jgi:hypothetical protein